MQIEVYQNITVSDEADEMSHMLILFIDVGEVKWEPLKRFNICRLYSLSKKNRTAKINMT